MTDKIREKLEARLIAIGDFAASCRTGPGLREAMAHIEEMAVLPINGQSAKGADPPEVVAWGLPNTAITGKKMSLMMVRLDIPSDDQYDGQFWVPLYASPDEQPAPIIPDGYAILPTNLTAENGAKAALIGEFSAAYIGPCSLCDDLEASEDCEECAGSGKSMKKKIIDWTTIKAIYSAAVLHFTCAH